MSICYNSTTDWVPRLGATIPRFSAPEKNTNWIRIPSPGTGVWEMSADVAMGILSRCSSRVWRTCHRHHHIIPSPYYETLPKWSRLCGDSLLNHMVSLNGGVERMNGGWDFFLHPVGHPGVEYGLKDLAATSSHRHLP